MQPPVFAPAHILLPSEKIDMGRWAALACDQYTSQPEYWQKAAQFVGEAASTLNMVFPEVYLELPGSEQRIKNIHAAMQSYKKEVLCRSVEGFVYVERQLANGVRRGLVGSVDLEAYSYKKGQHARVRPTEGTVEERIPPRLAVRRGAVLESPHILMLIDDATDSVLGPLERKKAALQPLYDTELMLGGGRVSGWAVSGSEQIQAVQSAIAALENAQVYGQKYGAQCPTPPFAMAVGDGNHSLATAKALWEELKPTLSAEQQKTHPARYCMVELENVHDTAIEVEPIHRVVFGVSGEDVLNAVQRYIEQGGAKLQPQGEEAQQRFVLLHKGGRSEIALQSASRPLAVGTVDDILDVCKQQHPNMVVDYIHGEDAVQQLVEKDAVGIILSDFPKDHLFHGVAWGGILPRKTFSMGHAYEKRYYLECRAITEE